MPKNIPNKCGRAVELRCIKEDDIFNCYLYDQTGKPCGSGVFRIKRA